MSRPEAHGLPTNDPPVDTLRNLGPVSAQWLGAVGVERRSDLEQMGSVLAYRIVKSRFPEATLNLLYSLHGALCNTRWDRLPEAVRRSLRRDAEAALQQPPTIGD